MSHEEPLPARIDRYEPLKRLAIGGMAEIFLAKQSGLEGFEKVVVLKRILSHLATDEEFVNMFLDEARIAAKLSHPNVVQIYDLGKADTTYYIAMEYVSGRNVQHLITKSQNAGAHLPVEHVCRIIAGVCDGLFYAHGRKDYDGKPLNIIHRDISPQNILVSFAGGVKVVDFGIAKASIQLAQTRAGVLKGKYAYMSPEQVRGAKIDHRSDIFAVGLVMYEMLTGVRAFERENSLKTLKAIVQEKPLNPREMNPDIPMDVVKLLSKALEKNPDRRYKTAQEMQLALEDWLESSPKKSNGVRFSRFLYDLFDDELNSAEGTMVVKGVGQVIIPTSQGKDAKPAVAEEVDSKTVSAALADGPAEPVPALKPSSRVRDELAAKAKPPAPKPAPPPSVLDDEDDGRTVPGVDIELACSEYVRVPTNGAGRHDAAQQVERDRLERQSQKHAQAAANATMESEPENEDTRAGVPMSTPSAPPMAAVLKEPTRDRRRPGVETPPLPRPAAHAAVDSLPDNAPLPSPGDPLLDDDLSELATHESQRPPAAALRAQPMYGGMSQPDPEPSYPPPRREDTHPGIDTPDNLMSPVAAMEQVAPAPAKKPGSFYALVGSSVAMMSLAVLLFAAGALAIPAPVAPTEFGVVTVKTTPVGASVTLDNNRATTPTQLVVPLDGTERAMTVTLPGFRPTIVNVVFQPGQNATVLDVQLEPQ